MRLTGHVARKGIKINAYRTVVGDCGAQRPVARRNRRCKDNIKMYVIFEGVDWMEMARDRVQSCAVVNTVMNLLFL